MRGTDLPPPAGLAWRQCNEERRAYRFLTWVFGGGVRVRADRPHVKDRDLVTAIRGASVRGQLRFWWRAVNPRMCKTVEELHHAEGEVWGTTDRSSPVIVEVTRQPALKRKVEVFCYREGREGSRRRVLRVNDEIREQEIAYGAFPLQPAKELQGAGGPDSAPGVLFDYGSSEFELRLRYPKELQDDVAEALWAWESFGGLGARTRRGFGAIATIEALALAAQDRDRRELGAIERTGASSLAAQQRDQGTGVAMAAPGPEELERELARLAERPAILGGGTPPGSDGLKQKLAKLVERPLIPGVPSLAGARLEFSQIEHDRSFENPIAAWNWALGKLGNLRQAPLGRNPPSPPSNRPGRSRWPEPDEIRRLTGRSAPAHRQPVVSVPRFPRAAFGLPIVFHFQNDSRDHNRQGDPEFNRLELRPRNLPGGPRIDRFASPLILRPVPVPGGYRAAALVLSSQVPEVELLAAEPKQGPALPGSPFPVEHRLTPADAARIPALCRNGGQPWTDPLARFLEEFAL